MIEGRIIAISGIMGSGKTTLCQKLAYELGWSCLPEPANAKKYLNDFFNDLNRYAYATQMAFLCNKALKIIQMIQDRKNIIVDRSIYEDVSIFARYWYDKGYIDNRDYEVYSDLAAFFLEQIPSPEFIIYCQCSLDEVKKRINKRDRFDQKKYPKNHIEEIEVRYGEWISTYCFSPVFILDTEFNDVRINKTAQRIKQEIIKMGSTGQLTLFADDNISCVNTDEPFLKVLKPINDYESRFSSPSFYTNHKRLFVFEKLNHPWAYLAAPFTSVATQDAFVDEKQITLFDTLPLHGIIKAGEYRSMLLSIEKKLKVLNIDTLIPHRDINKWGNKRLTPKAAATICSATVKQCDLFIGILGDSSGSHYELGIAEGESKPTVIILCDEIRTSFIGNGMVSNFNDRLVLRCNKISEISNLFEKEDFLRFVEKNINIH